MLVDFDAFLEELKSNQANFETNISKQFDFIRNKIDLQLEELKKTIDEIALVMIDTLISQNGVIPSIQLNVSYIKNHAYSYTKYAN